MPSASSPSIVTRPARFWWLGPTVALIGFFALAGGATWDMFQQAGLAQARVAAQGVRAASADANAALIALASGQDAADQLTSARSRIQADVNALDHGGYAESGLGRQPVPAATDRPVATRLLLGVVASPVDRVLGSLADHVTALSGSSQAYGRITGDISTVLRSTQATNVPAFGSRYANAWSPLVAIATPESLGGVALSVSVPMEAAVADLSTFPAPADGSLPLAPSSVAAAQGALLAQWRVVLTQNAATARALSDQASADSSLSSSQRQQAQQVAAAWSALMNDVQAASSAELARTAAVRAWSDSRPVLTQLDNSAATLDAALFIVSDEWGTPPRLLAISGAALTLFGALWALAGLARATDAYWRAEREHMSGGQALQALLRVTSSMRRIINKEGRSTRLVEDPQSPSYGLAALVNQMLMQRDEAITLLVEQQGVLSNSALVAEDEAGRGQSFHAQARAAWDNWDQSRLAFSSDCQRESSAHGRLIEVRSTLGNARARLEGLVVAMGWTTNELREQTQGVAKRIKRQGEDAQSLSSTAESVVDTNKKVRVLALNLAVAAAAQGDQGRPMASLANELERLADEVSSAMGDIASRVEDLQENVRDAATGSERNTASLVILADPLASIHQTLGQTEAALSDWDAANQDASEAKESSQINLTATDASAEEARGSLERTAAMVLAVRTHAVQIREASLSISRWLVRYGFNS